VVQACHAAIEAARAFLSPGQEHPFLVVCGIRDEPRLYHCLDQLTGAGVRLCAFREPDLGGQLTALATEPIHGRKREVFRKFQRLADGR
jgi:hypothetical protein